MVICEINGNAPLAAAMKKRTEGEIVKTYLALIQQLKNVGIKTKHQILDNEEPDEYKQTIKNNGMTYQLVPPDMHWRNIAEKAIQTFTDHFVVKVSVVDDTFPMHLWDWLLPLAEMMLNLLRQSKLVPKYLHGLIFWTA